MKSASSPVAPASGEGRRFVFFLLVGLILAAGLVLMADLLWRMPVDFVRWPILAVYAILLFQLAFGFATMLFGTLVLCRRRDPLSLAATDPGDGPLAEEARTAIIIPVYNEDSRRVCARLRTIYRSLKRTGHLAHFDFFILSDSTKPNVWIAEEVAWVETCRELDASGRVFYRKRRLNINKKSGNVSDFCRRWGGHYRYMVCLDADSLMSGESIIRLVRRMEAHPNTGIIQTAPALLNAESPFARMQQFVNRLYGRMSAAGLNFWQQGEGNYWGHNAIIRIAPFIEHCALPDLPGVAPFGGRILSHDFVEAALMRKAGYAVWLAYDLDGTYEETPPSLVDSAARDQRWCQGNLQHTWLLFSRGLHFGNRLHLFNGILGYASSLLWLAFLVLSTVAVYRLTQSGLTLFFLPSSLGLPLEASQQGLLLFLLTVGLILSPKVWVFLLLALDRENRAAFGGFLRVGAGVGLEIIFFTLLAPVMMLLHANFVIGVIMGRGVAWNAQNREGEGTAWLAALRAHGGQTVIGIGWGLLAWMISPVFLAWMSPLILGWLLAVPLSVWSSRPEAGRWLRQVGLFLVPEETRPSEEVKTLRHLLAELPEEPEPIPEVAADFGLIRALLDPSVNAIHTSLLRLKQLPVEQDASLGTLRERLLREGAPALAQREKMALLGDFSSCAWLHRELWLRPPDRLHPWWHRAIERYNRESLYRIPESA